MTEEAGTREVSYRRLPPEVLRDRARQARALLSECVLCPRRCRVNRLEGQRGFCRTGERALVSSFSPHFGEEDPLVGRRGSGTIFLGGCNLGCLFCQNYRISHLGETEEVSAERLASMMLWLEEEGCHNINLVTPTHQVPAILDALILARQKGLSIPLVYNCGGYESVDTIRLLEGIVDIYMPDIKFSRDEPARKYCQAEGYSDVVRAAVLEMYRQVGDLVMDATGVARRGLLVRHLVLPGGLAGTAEVVRFLAQEVSRDTYLNVMAQYHPCYKAFDYPEIARRPTREEYLEALDLAEQARVRRLDHRTGRAVRMLFR